MYVHPDTLMTGMFLENTTTKEVFKITFQNKFIVYLKNISTGEVIEEFKSDINHRKYVIVDIKGNYTI